MKFKMKHIAAITIATIFLGTSPMTVFSDYTVDDIRYQLSVVSEQQAYTVSSLISLRNDINYLEQEKNTLLGQIDEYEQQLVVTIATINTINKDIQKKENDLKQTKEELKKVKAEKNVQQEAMKKRMQYIYEEGSDEGLFSTIFEVNSISDIINRVINTQQIYNYDRKSLNEYMKAISEVEALQAIQKQQKTDLVTMKREQQSIQGNLENLKKDAEAASKDRQDQILYCEGLAAQYETLIEEQNAQIWQLQALQAQAIAAEQARIAAAQQAIIQAQMQMQAQQTEEIEIENEYYQENYDYFYTDLDYNQDTSTLDYVENNLDDYNYDISYDNYQEPTYTPTVSNGDLGSEIASYATQFVGNPYVWGGTSLTNGADCSGFVQSVFGDYGIDLSRKTYTQANQGVAVSYSDMQPGDVINYGFHTAIYLGDNQIVHAADENSGIIISNDPAYQPIVTIRRFV